MYVPGTLETHQYQIILFCIRAVAPVTFVMKTRAGGTRKMHTSSGVPRGVWGVQTPLRNSEGLPKSCQTQPYCENC